MSKTLRQRSARSATATGHSLRLFISYSHQNRVWMERLTPLLNGFQYDHRLRSRPGLQYLYAWHDNELTLGNPWHDEIKRELEAMDIFVPLVSGHFFGSGYIQNVELARATERFDAGEILVVPIVLYDTNLEQKCPFLYQFGRLPAWDRWWSSYPDANDAHRPIDDGLWKAIDAALTRKGTRKP